MYSPYRFASRVGNIGTPLPDPYHTFSLAQVQFRRGATSMIAGTPGSYKSVFALNLLAAWGLQGISGLYFSADSEEFTVVKRLSGILTGENLETVERRILRRDRRYQQELKKLQGVEFEYAQMDMRGLAVHVKSYEAIYGEYPAVVFLDNLIDYVDAPDDWGGMLSMTRELDALAREIKSHICILHHAKLRTPPVTRGEAKPPPPFRPPADHEIQGKVTQIPRLVLTMAAEGPVLRIAAVKNTNGPSCRDGSAFLEFQVLTSMRVDEVAYRMGQV